jgi:hypothetical protein
VRVGTGRLVCTSQKRSVLVRDLSRFFYHDYILDAATVRLISERAAPILASLADSSSSTPVIYVKYVSFLTNFRAQDVVGNIVVLVMHLFFYIADDIDACLWAAKSQASSSRQRRRGGGREVELYYALKEHLPEYTSCKLFVANMKKWRNVGCRYAFLARRLGLGSLVLARVCPSSSVWPCFLSRPSANYLETGTPPPKLHVGLRPRQRPERRI